VDQRRRYAVAVTFAACVAAGVFGLHHYTQLREGHITDLELIVIVAYIGLVFTTIAPYFHRDIEPVFNELTVLVVVPAHNEDPNTFLAMLRSIARQTHLPVRLHIVENGNPGYIPALGSVVEAWRNTEHPTFDVRYDFNPVAGKREAQQVAIRASPDCDIIMTLDSDVELGAPDTIARGIAPFAAGDRSNNRVASVCGFLIGSNWRKNLLTRLVDLGFLCSFLNGRASYSLLGTVAVNTGGLAFYRGWIVRKYLDHYLNHRIFGRQMQYGDDAMLTRYCMLEGHTVFQRSAWGYTLHPERHRHLARQRARWHRSWFWGNLWLIRTFNPLKPIWLLTVWQFTAFLWFTVATPYALIFGPILHHSVDMAGWLLFISYLSMAPYLTVNRPDMTAREQFAQWLLAPLAAAFAFYIGWALRYWGLFTCLRTGWSTRQSVEVGVDSTHTATVDKLLERQRP
jgi:hyaluronan synthase